MEEVLAEEIWKPLVYHGEYFGDTHEISNMGRLRSTNTNKILKQNINHEGYLTTVISRGRARKICIKIHRAVAENFVDGDKTLVINHKDLNKLNNRWDNLEFVTYLENTLHAVRNRALKTKLKDDDFDCIWELKSNGMTLKQIAEVMDVSEDTIWLFLNGKIWTYYYDKKPWLLNINSRPQRLSLDVLQKIAELKKSGQTNQSISNILGVTRSQVDHFVYRESYKPYQYLLS